ncbi:hypothetical protein OAT67_08725 [Bacteriovoracaceae bacterium]|nr:hypothetical protein [Bacteriovoracaceae bacterium]
MYQSILKILDLSSAMIFKIVFFFNQDSVKTLSLEDHGYLDLWEAN